MSHDHICELDFSGSLQIMKYLYFQVLAMAKRHKLIRDSYFGISCETNSSDNLSSTIDNTRSVESLGTNQAGLSQVELSRTIWKEQWVNQFPWVDYYASKGKIFYKICRENEGRWVYAKDGSKKFKVGVFTSILVQMNTTCLLEPTPVVSLIFWLISSTIGLEWKARMNFIPINEDSWTIGSVGSNNY